ncbi:predicted protein [Histoplasma capsulatum var. duboisii H88]|uniref:Predicted protein n=1 Tax=Ajellomyces capsulatus (strain H88) TaxID=544711 RepID=F0UTG7_AJEC8|nr:predicted protein [Histoplasma capsulatum var. duboisii H88]
MLLLYHPSSREDSILLLCIGQVIVIFLAKQLTLEACLRIHHAIRAGKCRAFVGSRLAQCSKASTFPSPLLGAVQVPGLWDRPHHPPRPTPSLGQARRCAEPGCGAGSMLAPKAFSPLAERTVSGRRATGPAAVPPSTDPWMSKSVEGAGFFGF